MIYWKPLKRPPLSAFQTSDCQSITGIIISAGLFVTQKKEKKNYCYYGNFCQACLTPDNSSLTRSSLADLEFQKVFMWGGQRSHKHPVCVCVLLSRIEEMKAQPGLEAF